MDAGRGGEPRSEVDAGRGGEAGSEVDAGRGSEAGAARGGGGPEPADALISPGPMDRPIRVVIMCGPVLERGMVRFARMLLRHPEVELTGILCQVGGAGRASHPFGLRARWIDLWRRRGILAPPLALAGVSGTVLAWLLHPGREMRHRRSLSEIRPHLKAVADVHAPEVLAEVRGMQPDLGAIYGGPILRPELFLLPRLGTLGIHHGSLPRYRGKKSTFWALYHGEPSAGVTIQRVNEGIDTGEVVERAEIPVRGRGYRRVWREVEEVGLDLYLQAVVGVKRGSARAVRPRGEKGPMYRDPSPGDILRFYGRRGRQRPERGDADAATGAGRDRSGPILLLTESYHPMVGGGESQARALAERITRAGRDVTVVTRRWDADEPAYARVDGCPVVRLPPAGPGHLKKWGLVATLVPELLRRRAERPTLLVCGFRVMGIPAALLGPWLGMRVVLKGDSPGEMSGEFFGPGLARIGLTPDSLPVRAFLALRNRILRRADAFVAISSYLAEELAAHGVPRERIRRIPNGIDLERFRPADATERVELRRRLGVAQRARVAIYTGRLVSYKGLPHLVRAWETVARRVPDAHLLVVGEGSRDIHDCEVQLKAGVQEAGLMDRVTFTGAVEDVAPWLRASDLFVFPSAHEAFGLSVVEAMACGLPVVSTRAGGLADIVSPEGGAVVVEPDQPEALAEALIGVLEARDEWSARGRAARTAAEERYGLDAVAAAYLDLLGDPRAPAPAPSAVATGTVSG